MKVFGDTGHFIALLSTGDRWHARAVAINRQSPGPLVTTEWVLTEVTRATSSPSAATHRFIYKRSVPARHGLFSTRPDKEWSLTDCISLVVMNERGITDALTNDHHFEQAGFQILLKD